MVIVFTTWFKIRISAFSRTVYLSISQEFFKCSHYFHKQYSLVGHCTVFQSQRESLCIMSRTFSFQRVMYVGIELNRPTFVYFAATVK